jgi:hypothetical protein
LRTGAHNIQVNGTAGAAFVYYLFRVAAVVADKFILELMVGKAYIAVFAFVHVIAGFANLVIGITAAVNKQNNLLLICERFVNR